MKFNTLNYLSPVFLIFIWKHNKTDFEPSLLPVLFIPLFYLDTLMPYNRTTFQLPPMATTECLCFLIFLLNCHSPKTTFYLTKTQSSTFFNFQTCHSTWALLMAEFEVGSHYVVQIDLKLTVKARLASVHNSLLRYWSSSVTDMHTYTQSANTPTLYLF